MAVTYEALSRDPKGAPTDLVPLTPSDAVNQRAVPLFFRGLRIETAGTVALITVDGNTRTFPSGFFATGVAHEIAFTRLLATGTTATVWGLV